MLALAECTEILSGGLKKKFQVRDALEVEQHLLRPVYFRRQGCLLFDAKSIGAKRGSLQL
jgi:hypothetical protein